MNLLSSKDAAANIKQETEARDRELAERLQRDLMAEQAVNNTLHPNHVAQGTRLVFYSILCT